MLACLRCFLLLAVVFGLNYCLRATALLVVGVFEELYGARKVSL